MKKLYDSIRESVMTSPMRSKPYNLNIKDSAVFEMRYYDKQLVLVDNVKFRYECELRWEAPKLSRDPIAFAMKRQHFCANNFDRTLIER